MNTHIETHTLTKRLDICLLFISGWASRSGSSQRFEVSFLRDVNNTTATSTSQGISKTVPCDSKGLYEQQSRILHYDKIHVDPVSQVTSLLTSAEKFSHMRSIRRVSDSIDADSSLSFYLTHIHSK